LVAHQSTDDTRAITNVNTAPIPDSGAEHIGGKIHGVHRYSCVLGVTG
jgi:hypothetical protein